MALYLVTGGVPGSAALVRARNGDRALAHVEGGQDVVRVTEDGPDGIVYASGVADEDEAGADSEIEVTSLSDRNRKFRNTRTGDIREEPFETDPAD